MPGDKRAVPAPEGMEKMKMQVHMLEEEKNELQSTLRDQETTIEELRRRWEKCQGDHLLTCRHLEWDREDMLARLKTQEIRETLSSQKIKEMESRLSDAMRTIEENNRTIKAKNMKISDLTTEIVRKASRDKESRVVSDVRLQCLERKLESLEQEHKVMLVQHISQTRELSLAQKTSEQLSERNTALQTKVRTSETELERLARSVRESQSYILRFREDLLRSLSSLEEPKKLKNKVMLLRKRYIDGEEVDGLSQHLVVSAKAKSAQRGETIGKARSRKLERIIGDGLGAGAPRSRKTAKQPNPAKSPASLVAAKPSNNRVQAGNRHPTPP